MPAVPTWSVPEVFTLTNPYSTSLVFNEQTDRLFALDQSACSFNITVRQTKDDVPQSDGSILHHRFLTGAEIVLAIQLWEDSQNVACDTLLCEMVDAVTGSFRSILNAGDNVGRLAWTVPCGNTRMLDDCRLLVYPNLQFTDSGVAVMTVTIDSAFPYAQDLTPQFTTILDGASDTITNPGTADYYPVYRVSKSGGTSAFIMTNSTTGETFTYSGTTIPDGFYAELNSFNNTIYMNGDGANLLDSVDIASSLFPRLRVGENIIDIAGADVTVEWAPAYG